MTAALLTTAAAAAEAGGFGLLEGILASTVLGAVATVVGQQFQIRSLRDKTAAEGEKLEVDADAVRVQTADQLLDMLKGELTRAVESAVALQTELAITREDRDRYRVELQQCRYTCRQLMAQLDRHPDWEAP